MIDAVSEAMIETVSIVVVNDAMINAMSDTMIKTMTDNITVVVLLAFIGVMDNGLVMNGLVVDNRMDNDMLRMVHYWFNDVMGHGLVNNNMLVRVRFLDNGSVVMDGLILVLVVDDGLMRGGTTVMVICMGALMMLDFVMGVGSCVMLMVRLVVCLFMDDLMVGDRLMMISGGGVVVTMVAVHDGIVRSIVVHNFVIAGMRVMVTTI